MTSLRDVALKAALHEPANICTECGHVCDNKAQAETCCTMQGSDCPECRKDNPYDGPDTAEGRE